MLSALVLWRRCLRTLVFGIIAQRENTRPRLVTNGYISISLIFRIYGSFRSWTWRLESQHPYEYSFFSLGSCAMSLFPPRVCCNGVESSILDSTCPVCQGVDESITITHCNLFVWVWEIELKRCGLHVGYCLILIPQRLRICSLSVGNYVPCRFMDRPFGVRETHRFLREPWLLLLNLLHFSSLSIHGWSGGAALFTTSCGKGMPVLILWPKRERVLKIICWLFRILLPAELRHPVLVDELGGYFC